MRRGVPRHDPRPSWQMGSARDLAGALRRLARRRQRGQHAARGAGVRPRREGLPKRAGASVRHSLPDGRLLGVQPFRGARGDQGRPRLHQRPRRGAAPDLPAGVRRRLRGLRLRVREGCGVSPGRGAAERRARPRRTFRPGVEPARIRRSRDPGAGRSGGGGADHAQGVHRRRADPSERLLDDAVADRPGSGRRRSGGVDLAATHAPRPHGDQARHRLDRGFLLACGDSADAVLQPALRRRHRQPGDVERHGRAPDLRRAGRQRRQPAVDGRLRRGDAVLRRAADDARTGCRRREPRRVGTRLARPARTPAAACSRSMAGSPARRSTASGSSRR